MQRTFLITDGDTALGAELVRLLSGQGGKVVATCADPSGASGGGKSVVWVPWNRRSPASAKNLVVSALNSVGRIDEALLLSAPPGRGEPLGEGPFHELPAAEIERALDQSLKPAAFLARELVTHFLQAGGGVLALVSFCARPADGFSPALERCVREGFKGLATSLLASYADSGFLLNAFQSFGATPEEFAQFIEKTLEEKGRKISGRWFTCQPRSGFIQGMFSAPGKKG
jgi:NAD(P)-dependent dehydrogenase (short-subunit alcohol dehydrogenase family)